MLVLRAPRSFPPIHVAGPRVADPTLQWHVSRPRGSDQFRFRRMRHGRVVSLWKCQLGRSVSRALLVWACLGLGRVPGTCGQQGDEPVSELSRGAEPEGEDPAAQAAEKSQPTGDQVVPGPLTREMLDHSLALGRQFLAYQPASHGRVSLPCEFSDRGGGAGTKSGASGRRTVGPGLDSPGSTVPRNARGRVAGTRFLLPTLTTYFRGPAVHPLSWR